MKWKELRIGDLGVVITGSTPSTAVPENFGKGYPFIKPPDLDIARRSIYTTESEISELGYDTQARKLIPEGTICVVCIGALGKLGLTTRPSFTNQQINSVVVDRDKHDPMFIYYLLKYDIGKVKQADRGSASGRENVKKSAFADITIKVPPLETQQAIAKVLAPYDDLIENNTRRMALLEEAMHLLYREWFVRLHFPGHEHTPIVDGVPAGWGKVSVTAVIDFKPQTPFPKDQLRPFIPMDSLSTNSMIIEGIEERPIEGGAKFMNGDTLLARITPCLENGKTAFVQFLESDQLVASGSTEFIVMRSISVSPFWTYCLARSHNFRQHAINSMVGSDGRQRVKPEAFEKYELAKPSNSILQHFDELVKPMFRQIQTLAEQNQRLREARDLLLPRLMNGAIPL